VGREYVGRTVEIFIEGLSQRQLKRAAGARPGGACGGGVSITLGGRALEARHDAHTACAMPAGDDEAPSEADPAAGAGVQLTGRTDGDLIVHVDIHAAAGIEPRSLIGRIVPVTITDSLPLSLVGALAPQPAALSAK